MIVDTDDLVGGSDIADRLGVSRVAVSTWRERHNTFPAPVATVGGRPVFLWTSVYDWHLTRETSRARQLARREADLVAQLARIRAQAGKP